MMAKVGIIFLCGLLLAQSTAWAQSTSPNYRVEESFFGTGGNVDTSSPSYRARQSTGDLGVGSSNSANFRANSGFDTPSEPFLEAAIEGPDVDLGTLSSTTTSYVASQGGSCNCTFFVRSYLSSQYVVYTMSPTLTNENGNTITAKSTQGAPTASPTVEEFGINLVANTVPGTFGANPANVPDNSFADGAAATGYQTANQFKYVPNDIIARSPATAGSQGVGRTDYTISYIAKVSNTTEAGVYRIRQNIVVAPTY